MYMFWYHCSLISSLYTRKLSLRCLWSYIYLWHVMVFNCLKKRQWVTKRKTLARGPSIWYDSAREVNNKTHECLKFQILCCTRRNIPTLHRSSHRRFRLQKVFLKIFAKFTGKHLRRCRSFNKVVAFRLATLLKNRLGHRCFHMNFAKV